MVALIKAVMMGLFSRRGDAASMAAAKAFAAGRCRDLLPATAVVAHTSFLRTQSCHVWSGEPQVCLGHEPAGGEGAADESQQHSERSKPPDAARIASQPMRAITRALPKRLAQAPCHAHTQVGDPAARAGKTAHGGAESLHPACACAHAPSCCPDLLHDTPGR